MRQVNNYRLEEICLEITNKCLLNCIHCSSNSSAQGEDLDKYTIEKIVDDFEEMGGKELEISGGEPLLHPHVWEILDYCKDKPFSVTLYSTGFSQIPVNEAINKINVDRVAIGWYNKEIAGVDYHKILREFIKGLKEKDIEVVAHFVPMKQNYKNFDRVLKECRELGIKEIKILRLIPHGRAMHNWKDIHIPEREFLEFVGKIKNYSEVKFGNPTTLYANCEGNCKAGISTCLINHKGEVYPCPALKNEFELCAGNVYEKSLKDLWENGFKNIREYKRLTNYSHCLAPWVSYSSFEEAIREVVG